MSKVVIFGGAGGIGAVASKTVSATDDFDEVVIADLRGELAADVAQSLDHPNARGVSVDATSHESLLEAMGQATVVCNCIGPFYRFGEPILRAAIEAGVNYVDVCDDLDATEKQLELDEAAKKSGICAVVGLGNSPGLANLLAKFGSDELLDECHSVDIMHIHGGEPEEGPAVIKHRIHAMVNDVPLFIDSKFETVRLLEDSGQRYVEEVEFRDVGTYPVYPYPHPETITLPKYLKGLTRATNRGVVFPISYFNYTMEIVREGLAKLDSSTPKSEYPIDDWVDKILSKREEFLSEAGIEGPKGCLKIVLGGLKDGEVHKFVFSVSSSADGAGAGTGIPAGLGAILLARGKISGRGVFPPEGVVSPIEALALASELLPKLKFGGSSGSVDFPLHVEHILPSGYSEEIPLGF